MLTDALNLFQGSRRLRFRWYNIDCISPSNVRPALCNNITRHDLGCLFWVRVSAEKLHEKSIGQQALLPL
jgi:hypothetical protein